jgi:hypothetical protein
MQHLSKAFESLFGSVTCLPGCFTLYRLRTSEHKPLLISNQIIESYSVNRVDTLCVFPLFQGFPTWLVSLTNKFNVSITGT